MAASRNGSDPSRSLQPAQILLARLLLAVPPTGPSADTSTRMRVAHFDFRVAERKSVPDQTHFASFRQSPLTISGLDDCSDNGNELSGRIAAAVFIAPLPGTRSCRDGSGSGIGGTSAKRWRKLWGRSSSFE